MVMVKPVKEISLYLFLLLFFSTPLLSKKADSIMSPILFQGNKALSTAELEEMIGVQKPPLYVFWKDERAKIDAKLRSKLNETFRLFYRSEGFYEANISHKITAQGIEVLINENRPIILSEIEIKSDVDLSKEVTLVKGNRFRAKEFSEMKNNIYKKLLTLGYCSPKLNTKAYISLKSYSAYVVIDLKKRKPCHFGKITIETNSSTMDNDIILSRLQFEEGDLFDISKIQESYDGLYGLESFDQLTLDYSKKFYNKKPINITYKEVEKQIHTRMGVGYATDLKFQAKLYAEYKNFKGNAKKLLFDGLVSDIQKIAEVRLFVPYVFSVDGYHFDFQNALGYAEERGIHEYDERVLYNKFYLSRSSSQWYMSAGFGIEQIETLNSEIANRTDLLIYPFIRVIFDKRDSKLNPKNGFYFSHEMEYGLPYAASNTSYLKYIDELRLIYTPFYDITWSAVGRIGSIKLYENNLPESKKFFAGGAFSNRGYGYERIGITESSTEDLALGGFTLSNLSLESNFPIYKNFRGAFFSDQTMISDNQGIWEFNNKVIHSAGFGFRYLTPIGPFKLDIGANVKNIKQRGINFQVGQSF